MAIQIVTLVLSIGALWLGALWIVESAARLARRIGLSDLVIGLTIVAIGTSLPELAVSVDAAFEGAPDIAFGNVIGSNIFNLGIILGAVALIQSIVVSPKLVWRDGAMLMGVALLLMIFLSDLHLARWEGGVMLAIFGVYLLYLFSVREEIDEETPTGDFVWTDIPRLLAGLATVLTGAHFLVESASALARSAGVSEWLIGVTVVAIGTSTPEMVTSLVALWRRLHGISAGNLIGSDIFNLFGALGLAAIVHPFAISETARQSLPWMMGMTLLLLIFMRSGWRLSRWEGALLIGMGVGRWIVNFSA
ncbi:MAG: calcium/sodium antiporter [Caldilineaceae bacterium]